MKKLIETKSFEDFTNMNSPINVRIKIKQPSEWNVSFYEENGLKYIYLENILEIEDKRLKDRLILDSREIIQNYQKLIEDKIETYSKIGVYYHHTNIYFLVDVVEDILKKQINEILKDGGIKIDIVWDEEKLLSFEILLSKCQRYFKDND